METPPTQDTLAYVRQKANDLEATFKKKLKAWGVQGDELNNSIRISITDQSDGYFVINVAFDTHGRFLDMGSGAGYSHGKKHNSQALYRAAIESKRSRKPKKWYTRPLYGWIYNLQEVIQITQINELNTAVAITFKQTLQ